MENEEQKKEKSVMMEPRAILSSLLNEVINTQAYIRALAELSLPKDKIDKFDKIFTKHKDALTNAYVENKPQQDSLKSYPILDC